MKRNTEITGSRPFSNTFFLPGETIAQRRVPSICRTPHRLDPDIAAAEFLRDFSISEVNSSSESSETTISNRCSSCARKLDNTFPAIPGDSA
jgi:hypothetical protein